MLNKKLLISLIISSATLVALPLGAQADLTIYNNTDSNATGIANDGICSSDFGPQGIIRAHTSLTINQSQLSLACGFNTKACKADIYMSDHCTGLKAGTIILDVELGVTSAEGSGAYTFTAVDPFNVKIDPA